jgi:hypothetical protein
MIVLPLALAQPLAAQKLISIVVVTLTASMK